MSICENEGHQAQTSRLARRGTPIRCSLGLTSYWSYIPQPSNHIPNAPNQFRFSTYQVLVQGSIRSQMVPSPRPQSPAFASLSGPLIDLSISFLVTCSGLATNTSRHAWHWHPLRQSLHIPSLAFTESALQLLSLNQRIHRARSCEEVQMTRHPESVPTRTAAKHACVILAGQHKKRVLNPWRCRGCPCGKEWLGRMAAV